MFSFKETRARDGGSDVKESRETVIRYVGGLCLLRTAGQNLDPGGS